MILGSLFIFVKFQQPIADDSAEVTTPVNTFHSVMESPEPVNLVIPPSNNLDK